MSNEKTTMDAVLVTPAAGGQLPSAESPKPAKDVKVISLSIDENDDFGGDPYNHTGSHCVLKFGERR